MRYLERRGVGFSVRGIKIPIVTGAILFDLGVGSPRRRPDEAMAHRACIQARAGRCAEGSVGAGTGASVGKYFGVPRGMKGGVGTATLRSGALRVGARNSIRGRRFMGIEATLRRSPASSPGRPPRLAGGGDNTTLGLIATNAVLTREQACRLATTSHVALARCLSPAHTSNDGDLVYALSHGKVQADLLVLEALAVEAMTQAILRAVRRAKGLAGIPGRQELGMD
jgi:L-aminopeptidase/D-esterase-like protein